MPRSDRQTPTAAEAPEILGDAVLDRLHAGRTSDPEWRYVPVRRTAGWLPEVGDEVIVGF